MSKTRRVSTYTQFGVTKSAQHESIQTRQDLSQAEGSNANIELNTDVATEVASGASDLEGGT